MTSEVMASVYGSPRMIQRTANIPKTPSTPMTSEENTHDVVLDELLRQSGLTVSEQAILPGRVGRHGNVPEELHPKLQAYLRTVVAPAGLYSHQALALKKFVAGQDLCLGTSTASGKSLIFGAAAAHVLLNEPGVKILACYPLKALAQDQGCKWKALGQALGFKVGVIHGGVATPERLSVLENSDVLLVTPDVIHSYLLGALPKTMAALSQVRMVILDELAAYQGVFASNAAYLFRRLTVHLGSVPRWITSTATIGNPIEFAQQITSRVPTFIGPEEDGSPAEPRRVLLLKDDRPGTIRLLKALSQTYKDTVLAFADSRKGSEDISKEITSACLDGGRPFLPFRAGFEEADRVRVQQALAAGELCGLVSTSCLEAGLDLPNVSAVILLNVPPSVQAALQRMGRIRGGQGTVLVFDSDNLVSRMGLSRFLARSAEPNSCYIQNPFLMYANALCAARELEQTGRSIEALKDVPGWGEGFVQMVANELRPSTAIPENLFPLKQRVATRSPHLEFGLRGSIERNLEVLLEGNPDHRLGSLTVAQSLREAGPGMIYGYLAKSYRVVGSRDSSIFVRPESNRFARTTANLQTMAFPQWTNPTVWAGMDSEAFVAVTNLQISERLLGFSEKVGKNTKTVVYGPGSPYSQRPILRMFPTTGVAFGLGQPMPEAVGEFILKAYAQCEGIHARDLGTGPAQAKLGPQGGKEFRGLAIFDAACAGGLDLTRRLAENFRMHVEEAARLAELEGPSAANVCDILKQLAEKVAGFRPATVGRMDSSISAPEANADGWIAGLIPPGEFGLLDNKEVQVLDLTSARDGVKYRLQHDSRTVRWLVPVGTVQPLPGGKTCRYHPDTGDLSVDE